jgi:fumarate hydratase subunit alpha
MSVREFDVVILRDAVEELCGKLACVLPDDIRDAIEQALEQEDSTVARQVLEDLLLNCEIAAEESVPMCQDTGMVVAFLDVGFDVSFLGDPYEAINEGVRRGYKKYVLRMSVVSDPLRRVNTGDNTPVMVTTRLVPGDRVTITMLCKGFGSENMSRLAMLLPADGEEGVRKFVIDTVAKAGPNACPPFVIGIGIGGTFDQVALAAKRALARPLTESNVDPFYAAMEQSLLAEINALGIGPQGFGGRATALGVAIEVLPTHIAGLPVAVNINCHAVRHIQEVL